MFINSYSITYIAFDIILKLCHEQLIGNIRHLLET